MRTAAGPAAARVTRVEHPLGAETRAGTTPTDYATRLLPGDGAVGDGITFVQDAASGSA